MGMQNNRVCTQIRSVVQPCSTQRTGCAADALVQWLMSANYSFFIVRFSFFICLRLLAVAPTPRHLSAMKNEERTTKNEK